MLFVVRETTARAVGGDFAHPIMPPDAELEPSNDVIERRVAVARDPDREILHGLVQRDIICCRSKRVAALLQ